MTESQALIDHEMPPARTEVRESSDLSVGVSFAFACYGLRIGIVLEDASWLEGISACLPPGWTEIQSDNLDRTYRIERRVAERPTELPTGVRLMAEETFAAWAPGVDLILDSLESQLQMYVAEFATPFLFVHAGVVCWQGMTIMLPGSSFAGKSTLVTALVDAGAKYYSDEYAVLDDHGRVLPYRRRISLREGPFGPARRVEVAGVSGDSVAHRKALPVDLVLFSRFEEGSAWSCDGLDHGPAILALCEHTVAIQRRPADALAILAKVAQRARVYRAVRGDLGAPLAWMRNLAEMSQVQR